MLSHIDVDSRSTTKSPSMIIYQRDPLARLVMHITGGRPLVLAAGTLAAGLFFQYALPAINGTLLPKSHFIASLVDIPTAVTWQILTPVGAYFYVRQLSDIPRLFNSLFDNGVTGLSSEEYLSIRAKAERVFNHWVWFVLSVTILAIPWFEFVRLDASSPYSWYHAPNLWPYVLYIAVQYITDTAAIAYLLRYIITCFVLRLLLRRDHLRPWILDPDRFGGCAQVVGLVQRSLVMAGLVLMATTLLGLDTQSHITNFLQSPGIAVFVVVAVAYVTVVPYIVLYPLRLVLTGFRDAKQRLLGALAKRANPAIWALYDTLTAAPNEKAAEADVGAILAGIRTLDQVEKATDNLPTSLLEFFVRSPIRIPLTVILPPLASLVARLSGAGLNWEDLIRGVVGTFPH